MLIQINLRAVVSSRGDAIAIAVLPSAYVLVSSSEKREFYWLTITPHYFRVLASVIQNLWRCRLYLVPKRTPNCVINLVVPNRNYSRASGVHEVPTRTISRVEARNAPCQITPRVKANEASKRGRERGLRQVVRHEYKTQGVQFFMGGVQFLIYLRAR